MRLIDADVLLRPIPGYDPVKYTYEYGDVVTVQDVKSIPTIDAVPVVRCEDCKYYSKPSALVNYALGICSRWEDMTYPDGYCSYAERITENG